MILAIIHGIQPRHSIAQLHWLEPMAWSRSEEAWYNLDSLNGGFPAKPYPDFMLMRHEIWWQTHLQKAFRSNQIAPMND
jgi:hypothetical protein